MVRIDPVTKVVNTFSVAGLNLPSEFYGAAWTYGNGNLGFDGNLGGVYQIAVTNPASATPTFSLVATGPGPASTNNDGTSCTPGPVDLGIAKTGPAVVAPSGTVTWSLAVTNHGPNVSSGFVISDAVPAGYTAVSSTTPGCTVNGHSVSCLGGVLAVGATATVALTARAPAVGGCLTNTASVLGNEADPSSVNNTSSLQTCVPDNLANPAIDLVKTASPTAVTAAGQLVTYAFVVTNTGTLALSNVSVSDAFTSGGTGSMSAITCQAATLAPGASTTCTATYVVSQADVDAGQVTNTAVASGTPPGNTTLTTSPPSTATVTAVAAPGLSVVKSASEASVSQVGDTIDYRFQVTNTGNVTLSNVNVVDTQLAPAGPLTSGPACPSGVLAPRASETCTATYTVSQGDLDNGTVNDSAVAHATPPGSTTPVVSTPSAASVPAVPLPALTMVKSANRATVSAAGQVIGYRFLTTNTGNVTLRHVRVVDGMAGLSPISCPTDTLAPSASETCTATYTVTQADIDAGALSNTAVSVARSPQSTPVTSDPSKATVPVTSDVAASAPAASALAFTGLPAVQLTLLGLIVLLLGVLLLAVRRRLASDE
jgi:uncharacterized repeat protein (TIGR01451 family)